jgi:hypothetical protein
MLSASAGATKPPATFAGEKLYREGKLPSSNPLHGTRAAGGSIEGGAAACVNCHRPSGLGTTEGQIVIPPVTAKYLFRARARESPAMETDHNRAAAPQRGPYTDVTLARAIREGIGPDGRAFDYLMPRYKLDDDVMASLIAYLRALSSGRVPGVTLDAIHFATIVTPDSDPLKRQATLDVLEHFFAAKNKLNQSRTPLGQNLPRIAVRDRRSWRLHVWELTGDPASWKAQLQTRLAHEPVFAVISGVGSKDWTPIHSFCQEEAVPCLLPNVDLPVVKESDFYNVYYSRGVLLEADLMAHQLQIQKEKDGLGRITQVYRTGNIGAEASRKLNEDVEKIGVQTVSHPLRPGDSLQSVADLVKNLGPRDAVVLWLSPEDLKALPADAHPASQLYLSGLMGGLENSPVSGVWRDNAYMTYPFELPAKRSVLLNYPLGWFRIQHIPIVAERTLVDTYVTCEALSENMNSMGDDIVRDYLVERFEMMLSSRTINGYYSRLALAAGQRFASKGGYIVRFSGPGTNKLSAASDWIVP